MASLNSVSQDCHMVDIEYQADGMINLTSPQASVDATSKDIGTLQEELERRLKQRVGRHDLVQRNILPPLALPTAPKLFTQTQQLQKARLADNLQKKLRNRADRNDLMQMNILPNLQMNIDPGLHATQLQLKKNKLADQLNDKIANRPGPLQLLREGILNPTLREMVKEIEFEPPETAAEAKGLSPFSEASPPKDMISPQSSEASHDRKLSDSSISPAPSPDEAKSPIKSPYSQTQSPRDFTAVYPQTNPPRATQTPGILSSGIGKAPSPSQTRKSKQKQQKYRKLRYHEYVPPSKNNGKGGKTTPKPPPKSDSPYSLILQQQQMFLQLQVLQQQYPNGVLMQKLPDLLSSLSKDHKALALAAVKGGRVPVTSPSADGTNRPVGLTSSVPQVLQVDQPNKHNVSTVRFDDLKVNDLKAACKELGMIVSGKKAELVERLLEHNKGLLPSIALPDGLNKDSKRQSFSTNHTSSIDSQHSVSSLVSPKSPSTSPVFTFPSDHRGGHGISNGLKPPSNPPPCRVESMPTMPLPEVFPATTLQQEFDEMVEQQKLNYMSRRGPHGKSLAPRPELNGLVAIRVPPAYSSAHNTQLDNSQMPSVRAKGSTLPQRTDSSKFLMADKSSRSLPSSPQPLSPNDGILNLMDDTPAPETQENQQLVASSGAPMSVSNTKTVMSNSMSSLHASITGTVSNQSMVTASESMFLVPNSLPMSTVTTAPMHNSVSDNPFFHSKISMRPNRSSVPVPPIHANVHPMNPPSYGSQLMQRSISLSGPPHHVQGGMGAPRMHTGTSFGSDISDIVSPPGGEAGKPATPDNVLMSEHQGGGYMDMPMDTDHNLTEIFEILRADGTVAASTHPSQPHSLPVYPHIHHHSHNAPLHTSYGSPTKLNSRQDSAQSDSIMLGGVMPFGNPPLGIQNRTGSDICLNIPREGQKNSTGSIHGGNNVMLSEELQWLDLDCANTFGVSPTMNSGFSNLNRHSNPGSLQHEQFHVNFLDDSIQHSGLDGGMRSLNQDFNSGVPVNGMHSFLDTGIPHPSGLFPASEESTLVELGLSTS